jgi:hypothetical protein
MYDMHVAGSLRRGNQIPLSSNHRSQTLGLCCAGDILQGLALMDATAGDSDPFWELYAEHLLPPPEEVTLPMAWGPELLQQLQHDAIIEGAQKQQVSARQESRLTMHARVT